MKYFKRQIAVMCVGIPVLLALACFVIIPVTHRIESISLGVFLYYGFAFVGAGLLVSALYWAISRDIKDEMKDL